MTDDAAAKYAAALERLLAKTDRLQSREIERVRQLLERLRVEVAARVAETEWEVYYLQELKVAISRAVAGFESAYKEQQQGALANMWLAGQDMIVGPLMEAGFFVVMPSISRAVLEILQGYSADLITGLAADLLKMINNEITMGVLGGKSPYEVMQAIGTSLESKGVFKSIMSRAETITRTEMARVHSLAREARLRATVAANPEVYWQKRWHSSHKAHPRPVHASLDGVTIDLDDLFAGYIPYPHAPGLPAKETVNCGCTHTLTTDWDAIPAGYTGPAPVASVAGYQEQAIYD